MIRFIRRLLFRVWVFLRVRDPKIRKAIFAKPRAAIIIWDEAGTMWPGMRGDKR